MLCKANESLLVIVDVQQAFASTMDTKTWDAMIEGCTLLLDTANLLAVPVISSEQYPQGLGSTLDLITRHLPENTRQIAKTCFSCAGSADFQALLEQYNAHQLILAGIESHACILQTAMQLHTEGKQVFVVDDACCSSDAAHHLNAMQRMRQAGIIITNTESVVLEWLGDARHEGFKEISALLKARRRG